MKRFFSIAWRIARITLLLFLIAAWPLSYLRTQLAIGWQRGMLRFGDAAMLSSGWRRSGGMILLERDMAWLCVYHPIMNPKPVIPNPGFTLLGDHDDSHWFGSVDHRLGFGTILMGQMDSPDWESCIGVMFPLWPVSLAAAAVFLYQLRRLAHKCRRARIGGCPKCSYDLRAHKPGEKCPECGAVISTDTKAAT